MTWLPIAMAPKDGTWLLVHSTEWADGLPEVGCWSQSMNHWQSIESALWEPTHWMPLPPWPSESTAAGDERDDLLRRLLLLINAAYDVIEKAEDENWLEYNGTDDSRLQILEDALEAVGAESIAERKAYE